MGSCTRVRVVTLADTCAGYGCIANLPAGAIGFTTIELKSNHLGTARDGTILGSAKPAHLGKTTQVWDAAVTHKESGKTLALFRCTQMILYPKAIAQGPLDSACTRRVVSPARDAPVAQLDRVLPSEGRGHWFESSRAHQNHRCSLINQSFSEHAQN